MPAHGSADAVPVRVLCGISYRHRDAGRKLALDRRPVAPRDVANSPSSHSHDRLAIRPAEDDAHSAWGRSGAAEDHAVHAPHVRGYVLERRVRSGIILV